MTIFTLLLAAATTHLTLAERGAAPTRTIVLPHQPSVSQRYAAEELRAYIKEMTGVEMPITSDEGELPPAAIIIGETRHTDGALGTRTDISVLGDDGFRLVAKPPHLIVLGSTVRGCLYGVYELLERHGGCRWYASWHTVVPQLSIFSVPDNLDSTSRPDFPSRAILYHDITDNADFAARLRLNARTWGDIEPKYGGNSFRFCNELPSCHTFNKLLPPPVYQKDHPEYFSKVGTHVQPCLTNPDVLAIVTSNVLRHITLDPTAKAYGVSQNDWYDFCTCPRCKAIDDEEQSNAGTMVRFVNAIAEAVERQYPDKLIETLAYQYTRKPPAKSRLRKNVVPCLCSIECDFSWALDESKYSQNQSFTKDLTGWDNQTDLLYIWDYTCNFGNYPAPFPDCYAIQGNLRLFRRHHAQMMFIQGAYQGNLAGFYELKAWLLSKWMWNADLPMKELLDDFFHGYYGPAAPHIRQYFEVLHQRRRERSVNGDHPMTIFEKLDEETFNDDFWLWSARAFDRAKAAVVNAPAIYAQNVRRAAFSVDYVRFMRMKNLDCDEARALAKSLLSAIDEFAPVRLCEIDKNNNDALDRIRSTALGR